jgi:hypothetical protein
MAKRRRSVHREEVEIKLLEAELAKRRVAVAREIFLLTAAVVAVILLLAETLGILHGVHIALPALPAALALVEPSL